MILVEVTGAIGRITLNAPDRLNAVDAPMLEALADAVTDLDARPEVRVISLTGSGRGFCSGAFLDDRLDLDQVGTATLDGVNRLARAVLGAGTPVVALVNGVTAGLGCSIALVTSYVLATESASFVLAFGRIGLMPDGGATALVAASIGRARALRMAISAEPVDARTAHAWGLIAEACPDEAFGERSEALLRRLAAGPTRAIAATTAAINAATLGDIGAVLAREEQGQTSLLASADFREGTRAFAERRTAHFTGE
jgi:enoyl-CoA hydratase/carnithine racemase